MEKMNESFYEFHFKYKRTISNPYFYFMVILLITMFFLGFIENLCVYVIDATIIDVWSFIHIWICFILYNLLRKYIPNKKWCFIVSFILSIGFELFELWFNHISESPFLLFFRDAIQNFAGEKPLNSISDVIYNTIGISLAYYFEDYIYDSSIEPIIEKSDLTILIIGVILGIVLLIIEAIFFPNGIVVWRDDVSYILTSLSFDWIHIFLPCLLFSLLFVYTHWNRKLIFILVIIVSLFVEFVEIWLSHQIIFEPLFWVQNIIGYSSQSVVENLRWSLVDMGIDITSLSIYWLIYAKKNDQNLLISMEYNK